MEPSDQCPRSEGFFVRVDPLVGVNLSLHTCCMSLLRSIYLHLRYRWRIHYLLPLAVFVLLILVFAPAPLGIDNGTGDPVTATITSIGVGQHRYLGRTAGIAVSAETPEGAVGSIVAMPADVAGCAIGDEIPAEQEGILLHLKPKPCFR